ncbi:hypothetical protein B0H14DRAFT_3073652 [Mycena olivaceomarginata]|nr:hypothetical protein B0H14DRAFT_3073652 [Mycena olivaceomarginata]
MGSTPSIFVKTPQEHAEAAVWDLEKHVRVEFYAYHYRVRDGLWPDIEAVLPLEKSGELSLSTVRWIWGLETTSIIDPLNLKLGFPADLNLFPGCIATKQLAKHNCIKLIAGARNDYCHLRKHLSEPIYTRTTHLTVFLTVLLVDLGFRLGEAVVDTVAASTCLILSLWACLTALSLVAPEAYAKALEMEDIKLMVVLSR